MNCLLECNRLSIARGGRTLCRALDWQVRAGECWGILGLNGAGKTTLLHTLAGLNEPAGGELTIKGRSLPRWRRRALATVLGLMPQDSRDPFPSTVLDTALIGRHPHLGPWGRESMADYRLARAALAAVDMAALENRRVATLSGGERRRLALATLLTQSPELMLLDEPVNHLDLHHQVRLLEAVKDKTRNGHAAVMVMHDLNMARRICDRVLLLFGDGRWEAGTSEALMRADRLSELYGHPVAVLSTEVGPAILPR